jgi:hypothetical protein
MTLWARCSSFVKGAPGRRRMEREMDAELRHYVSSFADDLVKSGMTRDQAERCVELPKAQSYLKKYFTETREPEAGAPLIAGAHWSLGLVYEKEGRQWDARNELETALRLKPDSEPAQRDLKRLK